MGKGLWGQYPIKGFNKYYKNGEYSSKNSQYPTRGRINYTLIINVKKEIQKTHKIIEEME